MLENIDEAKLIKVYRSREGGDRVYVWKGGFKINILNSNLALIKSINSNKRSIKSVKKIISEVEDRIFTSELYTNDMFYWLKR